MEIFDSNRDQVTQYFICPNDHFILNSLEKLDRDEYLYRLLREDGYERVIFIDKTELGNVHVAKAFDSFSRYSYHQVEEFQKTVMSSDPSKRKEDIRRFVERFSSPQPSSNQPADTPGTTPTPAPQPAAVPNRAIGGRGRLLRSTSVPAPTTAPIASASPDVCCLIGKQTIMTVFSDRTDMEKDPQFYAHFLRYVRPALTNKTSRTAVVIPLKLFDNEGIATQNIANLLDAINEDPNHRSNILIITADQVSDLAKCFEENSRRFHDWVHAVELPDPNKLSSREDMEEAKALGALTVLENTQRVVVVSKPGPLEIANYFFRKLLIEQDTHLARIPLGKVYHLASLLWEDLTGKTKEKPHFNGLDSSNSCTIQYLETELCRKTALFNTILQKLPDMMTRNAVSMDSAVSDAKNAVYLERITLPGFPDKQGHRRLGSIASDFPHPYEVSEAERSLITEELDEMIGLENVKSRIRKLTLSAQRGRIHSPGHYVFTGNPGTGKTVVARLLGQIFHAYGILSKGHLVEANRSTLVAGYVGQTAIKTREVCESALGGVLLVDEAYTLVNATSSDNGDRSDSFGQEAYDELMAFMENNAGDLCVIFTGYEKEMNDFIRANPGMKSRIGDNKIPFPDYNETELYQILELYAKKGGYTITPEYEATARHYISYLCQRKTEGFGNARTIRESIYEYSSLHADNRDSRQTELLEEDAPHIPSLNEEAFQNAMAELNQMAGLEPIKERIDDLYVNCRRCQRKKDYRRLKDGPGSYVFTGNPGTGKTYVATMMQNIFRALGLLSGTSHEPTIVTAGELLDGGLARTKILLEQALGNVLIVDEAYDLVNRFESATKFPSSLHQQIHTELMTFMYNHRNDTCIIFTGYEKDMKYFMEANLGMGRRLIVVPFPDYRPDQLLQILCGAIRAEGLNVSESFCTRAKQAITYILSLNLSDFGNAGDMKDSFCSACITRYNRRAEKLEDEGIATDDILTEADVPTTWKNLPILFGLGESTDQQTSAAAPRLAIPPRNQFAEFAESAPLPCSVRNPGKCEDAVLFIRTDSGSGTGFLIHPDGYALTCNHVIEGANKITARVRIPDRQGGPDSLHPCEVIKRRPDYDMAVIKLLDGSNFPFLPLTAEHISIERGTPFIMPGYPFGEETARDLTMPEGILESTEKQTDDLGIERRFISNSAKCGNSGSPLISQETGKVIGMLIGSVKVNSEEKDYMRPIHYFWKEFVK